ncbi:solute carrier family 66 member 3 isoform X2 [Oryctolagus cuniculus]|uniref:solute carrier family 66 member 3 isoform X2 n=1 Tax=Oryctolagus cuniculus TaxID=9986 RepID=UPI0004917DE7|nr:solute carrier family 66 member 3 isoform X2 [Oryctolagus cuniculus]
MEGALLALCNWSTLGVCAALKLPQIHAQLATRSARGISLPSLLLELAGFLVFLRYQCYYGSPLLTYLEYPILIAQALGKIRVFLVRPGPAEVDHRPVHALLHAHQRGQQVCAAPAPVEDARLGSCERPHLGPLRLHLCNENNNNANDHQRFCNFHPFCGHAGSQPVGHGHSAPLPEALPQG